MSFEWVVFAGVAAALGYGLDWWLGWSPWGVIGGLIFGIIGGGWRFIRAGMAMNRRQK